MGYMTPKQAGEKWGLTQQRVTEMCRDGLVRGAWRQGRRWRIPEDARQPERGDQPVHLAFSSGVSDPDSRAFPPPPIGISSYERVVSWYSSVDKTMLIKEVIDRGAQVTMFLRPRRFGKTLNMDMMRCFFEKGERDNTGLFRTRAIWQQGERYTSELGKYPVVWLSFKDVRGSSWQSAFWLLKRAVFTEYERHSELADSTALSSRDKGYYARVVNDELPETQWLSAVAELVSMLYKHHGAPVVVFVDEYDTPIQEAYLHGYYEEAVDFVRPFVCAAIKDNPYLQFGFFTGVTRVAKESIFSGLNNLVVDSMLGGGYAPYFGFTYDETRSLLREYGREDMFGKVIDWYDGYRIDSVELVNPWSVNCFISQNFEPQGYWQQTGSSEIIRQIVQAADSDVLAQLNVLMGGGQIDAAIDDSIAYPQVEGNPSAVFSFLLMAGYLRVDERENRDEGGWLCKVSVPNKEILQAYSREAIGGQPTVQSQTAAERIRMGILTGNATMIEENLGRYVREVVSFHDAVGEAFYHGMVVGLCAAVGSRYRVTSNRESGLGRYDVQLAPVRAEDPGVVIEVKAAPDDSSELQDLADAATMQILEKDYARDLVSRGVTNIITVGLAFRSKSIAVATRITPTEKP